MSIERWLSTVLLWGGLLLALTGMVVLLPALKPVFPICSAQFPASSSIPPGCPGSGRSGLLAFDSARAVRGTAYIAGGVLVWLLGGVLIEYRTGDSPIRGGETS